MTSKEILILIADIIQHYTNLDNGRIWLYNQKYNIPIDKNYYIVVGLIDETTFHNSNNEKEKQLITIGKQSNISINIFSYDLSALEEKDKILASFNSQYSQNKQDANGCHISTTNNWLNINETDGDKILYRFQTEIKVISKNELITDANYFDNINNKIIIDK